MKSLRLAIFTLLSSASLATAQGACPVPAPTPDPCLTGNWVGENTVAQRMQEILRSMPSRHAARTVFPTLPAALGITIWDDGLYATLPLHQNITWQDVYRDDTVTGIMDLTIPTQVGRIWGEGGLMSFCQDDAIPPTLFVEAISSEGSRTAEVSPFGGGDFTPVITYSCTPTYLDMSVMLPAPIGQIDYHLTKVSPTRFDEEFRDLIDRRFPVE